MRRVALGVLIFACGARTELGGVMEAAGDERTDAADVGEIDDIVGNFSATSNPTPSGHFAYGYTKTLGDAFTLYADAVKDETVSFWQAVPTPNTPQLVGKNETAVTVVYHNTATFPPDTVFFHPGPAGEYSVIRWTCPRPTTYALSAAFIARDTTTTDVHILRDGVLPPLMSGDVTSSSSPTYSSVLTLTPGETIDFVVGFGSNGNYYNDSTGISGSLRSL
jgi:hypothetical protein